MTTPNATRRLYSLSQHGLMSRDEQSGKRIVRAGNANMRHEKLSWSGLNTIRLFPNYQLDPGGAKVWTPFRNSLDGINDFGDWIRCYPAVRGWGGKVTFLMANPVEEPVFTDKPPQVLYRALDNAIKNGQEQQGWGALLRGGQNRSAEISKPTAVYLVQGAIFYKGTASTFNNERGGYTGTTNDNEGVLIELTQSAGMALLKALDRRREAVAPDTRWDDFESWYENGDPVSWEHGRFISFYNSKDGDPRARYGSGNMMLPSTMQSRQQNMYPSYICTVETSFQDPSGASPISPVVSGEFRQVLESKVRRWDDILWFPTEIEQAHMIAPLFPASLILYAFQDHQEWIPDDVRSKAVNAHTVGYQPVAQHPNSGWSTFAPQQAWMGTQPAPGYNPGQWGGQAPAAIPAPAGMPMPAPAAMGMPAPMPTVAGQFPVPPAPMPTVAGQFPVPPAPMPTVAGQFPAAPAPMPAVQSAAPSPMLGTPVAQPAAAQQLAPPSPMPAPAVSATTDVAMQGLASTMQAPIQMSGTFVPPPGQEPAPWEAQATPLPVSAPPPPPAPAAAGNSAVANAQAYLEAARRNNAQG